MSDPDSLVKVMPMGHCVMIVRVVRVQHLLRFLPKPQFLVMCLCSEARLENVALSGDCAQKKGAGARLQ